MKWKNAWDAHSTAFGPYILYITNIHWVLRMLYYSFEEAFICKICFASDLVQDNLYIFVSGHTVTYLTFSLTDVYTWGQTYQRYYLLSICLYSLNVYWATPLYWALCLLQGYIVKRAPPLSKIILSSWILERLLSFTCLANLCVVVVFSHIVLFKYCYQE